MAKKNLTRREFVKQNSIAGLGATVATMVGPTLLANCATENGTPAILGGQKVRTEGWPKWPMWGPASSTIGTFETRLDPTVMRVEKKMMVGRMPKAKLERLWATRPALVSRDPSGPGTPTGTASITVSVGSSAAMPNEAPIEMVLPLPMARRRRLRQPNN